MCLISTYDWLDWISIPWFLLASSSWFGHCHNYLWFGITSLINGCHLVELDSIEPTLLSFPILSDVWMGSTSETTTWSVFRMEVDLQYRIINTLQVFLLLLNWLVMNLLIDGVYKMIWMVDCFGQYPIQHSFRLIPIQWLPL